MEKFKNVQEKSRRYNIQYISKATSGLPPLHGDGIGNNVGGASSAPNLASGIGTATVPPNRIPTPGSTASAPAAKPKGGLGIAKLARGRMKNFK